MEAWLAQPNVQILHPTHRHTVLLAGFLRGVGTGGNLTTDAHLATRWRLLAAGQLAMEQPRLHVIRDTFLHSAHHRGQMTVYLRLLGEKVPSVYGPTADDKSFG